MKMSNKKQLQMKIREGLKELYRNLSIMEEEVKEASDKTGLLLESVDIKTEEDERKLVENLEEMANESTK